jgi:hypothetical protein
VSEAGKSAFGWVSGRPFSASPTTVRNRFPTSPPEVRKGEEGEDNPFPTTTP